MKVLKWVKRVILITIAAALFVFLSFGFVVKLVGDVNPPPIGKAPFIIRTSSYLYYTPSFTAIDGVPAIRTFWVMENGRYHRYTPSTPIKFTLEAYGPVDIISRIDKSK